MKCLHSHITLKTEKPFYIKDGIRYNYHEKTSVYCSDCKTVLPITTVETEVEEVETIYPDEWEE